MCIRAESAGGKKGGHEKPVPLPTFSLSKCEMQRFTTRLVHIGTPMHYMSHCFISCKHKTLKLQFPRDSFVAMPQVQRHIPSGMSSEKRSYNESPELHSSCQKICVVMVVTNGLSYDINFPGRTCTLTPLNTVSYACHTNFHFACMSPLLQSLDLPLKWMQRWSDGGARI